MVNKDGLRITYDYEKEERRLRFNIHLLRKLQVVDRVSALHESKKYTDEAWRNYENTALVRFGEIVSDLRNTAFVQEYAHVIENLVRIVRYRQDEGKFVQAEKWNDLFNHYEITRMGLEHGTNAIKGAKKA